MRKVRWGRICLLSTFENFRIQSSFMSNSCLPQCKDYHSQAHYSHSWNTEVRMKGILLRAPRLLYGND
jgi:hypothetical protein